MVVQEFESVFVDDTGEIHERRVGWARHLVCDLFQNVNLSLVEIPGGRFTMGSPPDELGHRANEAPRREVEIASFLMGKFPITQAQWQAAMGSLPPIAGPFRGPELPVVNASWPDVDVFCDRLGSMTGLSIRLPSEAEWEYACRAGTSTPFHWGPTISDRVANFNAERPYGNAVRGTRIGKPTPVGSFGFANAFGLYDMHGNVWEWCADTWHDDYRDAPTDGHPWLNGGDGGYRVQRGGSWRDIPQLCRSAFRVGDIAFNSDHIVGLRVCTDLA